MIGVAINAALAGLAAFCALMLSGYGLVVAAAVSFGVTQVIVFGAVAAYAVGMWWRGEL